MVDLVRRNVQIDWGVTKGMLPGRFKNAVFTDIDGFLEVNGSFLVIDVKFGTDTTPSIGQEKAYKALSKLLDFTVLYVDSEQVETKAPGVYRFAPKNMRALIDGKYTKWHKCDLDDFKRFYNGWLTLAQEDKEI